jgi:hypothetical protein
VEKAGNFGESVVAAKLAHRIGAAFGQWRMSGVGDVRLPPLCRQPGAIAFKHGTREFPSDQSVTGGKAADDHPMARRYSLDHFRSNRYPEPMNKILELSAELKNGRVETSVDWASIASKVSDEKTIVVLKGVFPAPLLLDIRRAVIDWGRETKLAVADDFRGNYHRQRAMVSRLQQAPHVFHDYNFNAIPELPDELGGKLMCLFEPLRHLYNLLTDQNVGFDIPQQGPWVHPQIIHYPGGGGFFGRHWHALVPQKLGFIVSLSEYGKDFQNGGTVFDIDGEIVNMEGHQQIGDICIWRYDYHHWVTQSDLQNKFDWNSDDGRWIATFAYFDPCG